MMPEYATQELEKVSKSKKTVIQSMCKIFNNDLKFYSVS